MAELSKIHDDVEADRNTRSKLSLINRNVSPVADRERSLAKTTKSVNRLKKFYSDPSVEGLIGDLGKLDMTMYMEELISAMSDAYRTMRLRDCPTFVQLCWEFSVDYAQFGPLIHSAIGKIGDSVLNDNLRLRIHVRVLTEFLLCDVGPRDVIKADVLRFVESVLTFNPSSVSMQLSVIRLTALLYWVSRYFPVILRDPDLEFFPDVRPVIESFYTSKGPILVRTAREEILAQEAVNTKVRIAKGELDTENEAKYAGVKDNFDKIETGLKNIQLLFHYPDLDLEPAVDDVVRISAQPESDSAAPQLSEADLQFTDETEKSFYLDLLDLPARLPSALFNADSADTVSTAATIVGFLSRFGTCTTRDDADELALAWFEKGLNSKAYRKQLGRVFLGIGSEAPVVSPAQCRFLATITPYAKDLVGSLLVELEKLARKKSASDQMRSIKLLGDLCKFSVCPPGVMLDLLQQFTGDLMGNGEAAAWLLVSCGRFLVNKNDTKLIAENLIDRLMKMRQSMPILPAKVQMAIDDAYFQAKPKAVDRSVVARSPIERYIAHLVHVEMYTMNEDALLRLVKRLPWTSDPLVPIAFKRAVLDLNLHTNFSKCHSLVSLLSGLVRFQEAVVVDIVDGLMEEFQVGLEKEDFRQAPSRVRLAKLIGELYVYRLIDSFTVFDLLYQLIGFRDTSCYGAGDHTVLVALAGELAASRKIDTIHEDEEVGDGALLPSAIQHAGVVDEPNWSFIRIMLVSTIILAVGEFFRKGKNRARMNRFLLLFRRYIFARSTRDSDGAILLPTRIRNVIADMFDYLDVKSWDLRKDSLERVDAELEDILRDLAGAVQAHGGDEDSVEEMMTMWKMEPKMWMIACMLRTEQMTVWKMQIRIGTSMSAELKRIANLLRLMRRCKQ